MNGRGVHFIAIGGIGMSALAKILLKKGVKVSGSDIKESKLVEDLRSMGAKINIGHRWDNVPKEAGEIVFSSAVRRDNPEMIIARERDLLLTHRGELLARLFNDEIGIAVAGAHGKTTTSGMISLILLLAKYEPSIAIGGVLPQIGSNAELGEGKYWVVEADESDGSFLRLTPNITIITNIEPEHMEHYGTITKLEEAFTIFLDQSECGIVCFDDEKAMIVANKFTDKVETYSIESTKADLYVQNINIEGLGSSCDVYYHGEYQCKLELRVPGIHNISNCLAALLAAHKIGISFSDGASYLNQFTGTGRRFEILYSDDDVVLVDDYAHHPTEVVATIKAAKADGKRRVIAVFQPHRYTRVRDLYREFGNSFGDADVVIIDDIYSAWEDGVEKISSKLIVDEIVKNGGNPFYLGGTEKILEFLKNEVRPHDLVLMMGAGDIRKTAEQYRDHLEEDNGFI